jgi:hypothetical protein
MAGKDNLASAKRIDIRLAEKPAAEFNYIKNKHNLSDERVITYLIDTYFLSGDTIYDLKDRLSNRVSKGVPRSFINCLKVVYVYLGHILKKLNQL